MKLEPANIICPKCGNGNYMRHLIGKNVGKLDMKCINCNSYFNFEELYKQKIAETIKPQTNADRIRSMSDEKLAVWIAETSNCSDWCKLNERCSVKPEYECCVNVWLSWLKEEVK